MPSLLFALALVLAAGGPPSGEVILSPLAALGTPVPPLALKRLTGEAVALPSFVGRPLLVNLWASWCRPCVDELPMLAELQRARSGLQVVAISIDELPEAAMMLTEDLRLPFTVLSDVANKSSAAFRTAQIPATFVYDREGKLVYRKLGMLTRDDPALKVVLDQLLGSLNR